MAMVYKKKIPWGFPILGLILAIVVYVFWKDIRSPHQFSVSTCAKLITTQNYFSIIPSEVREKSYIEHPILQSKLSSYIGHLGSYYIVLHGPAGSGKSALVREVISSQSYGVIYLQIIDDSDSNLYAAFGKEVCGIRNEVWNSHDVADVLRSAIAIARKTKNVPLDWVPTFVVEVENSEAHHLADKVAGKVKRLCLDEDVCRGVIVLSDISTASTSLDDPGRIEKIWVDDFSEGQSNEYFDKRGYLLVGDCDDESKKECTTSAATLRKTIFETIGTRPTMLSRVIEETRHNLSLVEPLLDRLVADCTGALLDLFHSKGRPNGQEFKAMAKLILQSPSLSVHMAIFQYPVNDAVAILEQYHAISYHNPTSSYVFFSKCEAIAARRLLMGEKK